MKQATRTTGQQSRTGSRTAFSREAITTRQHESARASATAQKRSAKQTAARAKPAKKRGDAKTKKREANHFTLSERAANVLRMMRQYDEACNMLERVVAVLYSGREERVNSLLEQALEIALEVEVGRLTARERAEVEMVDGVREVAELVFNVKLGVEVLRDVVETLLERANTTAQWKKALANPEGKAMTNAIQRALRQWDGEDGKKIVAEAIASELEIRGIGAR
ncbi:hypothetical protein HY992_03765 [Candidatus Micrarchaeota archaeon]|nr:hypothetical protein [Candidatus Micrarchaeota archaeon]